MVCMRLGSESSEEHRMGSRLHWTFGMAFWKLLKPQWVDQTGDDLDECIDKPKG